MRCDATCPVCGLYWTREENEDCPRCRSRLLSDQLQFAVDECIQHIDTSDRLRAECERMRGVVEAAKKIREEVMPMSFGVQTVAGRATPEPFPSPRKSYGVREASLHQLFSALPSEEPTP